MYPSLLLLHPDVASSVVNYRANTIAGARANAQATGYRGTRYAWESANDGTEQTPTWAETREFEQHITSDVAFGQWQYYLATGDRGWLAARGWPVLEGAADFWASRATPTGGGKYRVDGVRHRRAVRVGPRRVVVEVVQPDGGRLLSLPRIRQHHHVGLLDGVAGVALELRPDHRR